MSKLTKQPQSGDISNQILPSSREEIARPDPVLVSCKIRGAELRLNVFPQGGWAAFFILTF